jgi:dipeptidase D
MALAAQFASAAAPAVDNATTLAQALAFAPTEQDQDVLRLFFALAAIPHPSRGEEGVRRYLIQLADKARARAVVDNAGNLMVTVPGTGRYSKVKAPVVTLQAHMDMVWAVADAPPLADLRPYFAPGISLTLNSGWLQSVDHRTSIGADDGIGMAVAASYLVSRVDHPPLALLFTVVEEQGLAGAQDLKLKVTTPQLIGLDTFDADVFVRGCLGARRAFVSTRIPAATVSAEPMHKLTLHVAGLRSGHSGADIDKLRLNAVLTLAKLASKISAMVPDGKLHLVAAAIGSEPIVNAIPSAGELTLALPSMLAAPAAALAKEEFARLLREAKDETQAAQLTTSSADLPTPPPPELDDHSSRAVLHAVLALKNGVQSHIADAPNGVNTSSNLGYLALAPADGGGLELRVGYLTRSYSAAELEATFAQNLNTLRTLPPAAGSVVIDAPPATPPLLGDLQSPFLVKLHKLLPKFKPGLTSGTNELAVLARRFPAVGMVGIGPRIIDAHSPTERVELKSVFSERKAVDSLIWGLSTAEPQ